MDVVESLRMAWRAIRDHRLRSALTTLGIVIGVAAVIVFVTLGASLQAGVVGEVAGNASPDIEVSVGPAQPGGPPGTGSVPALTERDVDALAGLPGVERAVPRGTVATASIQRDDQSLAWQSATATTPAFFDSRSFEDGRAFEAGADELVVNRPMAELFDPALAPGDTVVVRYGGGNVREVTVVGVVEPETSLFGSPAPRVYLPTDPFYTTTTERPGTGEIQRAYPSVTVVATAIEDVPQVGEAVTEYLETESDARELKPAAYVFRVQSNEQLARQIQDLISTFTGFITAVALVSLVVGAIGIANVMLVSVTERTREVGIMKAVGARRRDVLQLFLVEAVTLGVVGSVLGTLLGVAGGYVAARLLDLPVAFAPEWFGVAVVVGVGVGVVSGLYPAWNAARIDPIEALRRE